MAVTAVSPSLLPEELEDAVSGSWGSLSGSQTHEMDNPNYTANQLTDAISVKANCTTRSNP